MELGFEFHRYFDLMRYGANPALGPAYINPLLNRDGVTGFSYATKYPFPIPQTEMDIDKALH
jgi:hypothetical protein